MTNTVKNNKRNIFFDESTHTYTDEFSNKYTSTTTLIHKYFEEFKSLDIAKACERIGRNNKHPKYLKYKGKTAKQLLEEWKITSIRACNKGNATHNYLEDVIKSSTNYSKISNKFINNKIYTIDDILNDEWIGRLSIDYFQSKGIDKKYPIIFNILVDLSNKGWKIYSEVGVYDSKHLISGLIDLPLIKDNKLLILDWKTNQSPIRFEAGYFEKDNYGKITDNFITKNEYFYNPIDYIPASIGHKYSMQLSGYANMAELFGLTHVGSILCHIRNSEDKFEQVTESVELVNVLDLKKEFQIMKEHYFALNHKDNISEKTLFQ